MNITSNSDGSLSITNASNKTMIGIDAETVSINGAFGDVHIGDDGTKDLILTADETVFTKFVANNPSDWQGTAPTYEWDAINRLAAACAAAGHKP